MYTLNELKEIYIKVQTKAFEECWQDLNAISHVLVDTNGTQQPEKLLTNVQTKINKYLDEYNLTDQEKQLFKEHAMSWGIDTMSETANMIKTKLTKENK